MSTYLTASDISRIHRKPLGTVYWLASRDKWRRTDTKPRGYHSEDVEVSMRSNTPSEST